MATIVTRAGKGSPLTHVEVDANFTNLNNDKAELASPTFTGTPAAPTATVGTNTTQVATTAFVNAEIANDITGKADLASPTFTGTPAAPTASVGTNTTQVATTAFVNAEIANDAPSKTGTGASGTWAISISGDAASVDGKSFGTFTAAGGVAYATDTSTLAATAAGTSGQVLQSNGASAPSWVTPSAAAPTTAQVGTATAGLAYGDVGSYGLFFRNAIATPGTTVAGSGLYPANTFSASASAGGYYSGAGTPSGTWRLMGETGYYSGTTSLARVDFASSVFLRIS